MSCMFRVAGVKLDIDRLLASIPLRPTMSYRKGEPRLKARPRGEKKRKSGAAFAVSTAEFAQFEKHKEDAVAFLKAKRTVIQKIMKWPGVDAGELDFGIHRRDVVVQCDCFSAELLKLAGGLGLDIKLSCYPPPEEEFTTRRLPRKSHLRLRRP